MKFYLNGKKISRKEAQKLAGTERFSRMVEEAQEAHSEEPNEEIDYIVRGGTLTIEIRENHRTIQPPSGGFHHTHFLMRGG